MHLWESLLTNWYHNLWRYILNATRIQACYIVLCCQASRSSRTHLGGTALLRAWIRFGRDFTLMAFIFRPMMVVMMMVMMVIFKCDLFVLKLDYNRFVNHYRLMFSGFMLLRTMTLVSSLLCRGCIWCRHYCLVKYLIQILEETTWVLVLTTYVGLLLKFRIASLLLRTWQERWWNHTL